MDRWIEKVRVRGNWKSVKDEDDIHTIGNTEQNRFVEASDGVI